MQAEAGKIHTLENFEESFFLVDNTTPIWYHTIKGYKDNNYYSARDFFEKIIPNEFGKYSFIQSLNMPEIEINDVTFKDNKHIMFWGEIKLRKVD